MKHEELKKAITTVIREEKVKGYDPVQMLLRGRGMKFSNSNFVAAYKATMGDLMGINDLDLIDGNVKIAKSLQAQRDLNRIERKSFREFSRLDNAMSEMGRGIVEILEKYDFSKITREHRIGPSDVGKPVGLVQLADLHLNELVRMQMNVYDFNVAAQRMEMYASKVIAMLVPIGVTKVVVANTGDILNSDRRLDEYLSQATNRTSATMLAVQLIKEFLLHLNQHFNVVYIQVSGNESRVKDEPGYSDEVLSDNYDALIYNILKLSMKTSNGIEFQDGDIGERVISIHERNILLIHGESIGQNMAVKDVQAIKGKYAQYGVAIDFVVCGHIHCTHVHDHWARSASLVGANGYTDRGLQLTTRASQNLHIFYENGTHDTVVMDLQDASAYPGYPIIEELERYHAKSEKKLHHQTVIHQVVI